MKEGVYGVKVDDATGTIVNDSDTEDDYNIVLTPHEQQNQKIMRKRTGCGTSKVYTEISSFKMMWPFVAFSSLKNYLCLYSAFDNHVINFIQIPDHQKGYRIVRIFITSQYDLFMIVQSEKEKKFRIYRLKLQNWSILAKNLEKLNVELIFEYTFEDVRGKDLLDMYVRSDSEDKVIDLNKKLIIFILHAGTMYVWQRPL